MDLIKPLPGAHYDADYFHGRAGKSNYTQGYTWESFGALFEATALWLTRELFPEVRRYLDVGCATGLLVKALREADRKAWGVDHSGYCLETAEPSVRRYLFLQSLDALALATKFDLVLAFETLEHLTEAQIPEALYRMRQHATVGLLATIPTPDMVNRHAWRAAAREPSHLTLRSRPWWRAQFLAAGWVYTPFHRLAECYCISHPLVAATGWNPFCMGVPS